MNFRRESLQKKKKYDVFGLERVRPECIVFYSETHTVFCPPPVHVCPQPRVTREFYFDFRSFFVSTALPVIIAIVSRSGLNEVYLSFVSYVVLATFLLIELSFGVLTRSQAVTVPTLVFVYISYSLLPVKLQYAIVSGTVFMLSQLIFTLSVEHGLSRQVTQNYDDRYVVA